MSIEKIEGIGSVNAKKLAKAGVRGVGGLLTKGATPKGREEVAAASGLSTAVILKWVNMADLFRIKGIGTQYSELLEAAGVDTVKELAQRNADNLHTAMIETNNRKKLVRQVPALENVRDWVAQAKKLPRAVHY
jgi:predicted flap endonuclease-1-like 5' DNA nuclease